MTDEPVASPARDNEAPLTTVPMTPRDAEEVREAEQARIDPGAHDPQQPVVPVMPDEKPRANAPSRVPGILARLLQAVWLGSGVFLMLTAAAAFSAASNPTDAANVVGAILTRWHYIALFVPVLLLMLEWRRSRAGMLVVLFVAIVLASLQGLLDVRIRVIRLESPVAISNLSPQDPIRRQFGFLHGISQLLLIGQVLAAGAAVAMREPDL